MATELNQDTLELCRALCSRAGMLLEDASAEAVLAGDLSGDELRSMIGQLRPPVERAGRLLAAAEVLVGR